MATLQGRLGLLITAVGTDVKALLARTQVVVINHTDTAPPGGTPAGTVVFKKRT